MSRGVVGISAAKLLVVEDDGGVRWSLVELMKQEGYEVLEAETAQQALEKFEQRVDLVLLDYALPDDDGLSVLRRMLERDPDVQIIMLTGHSSVRGAVDAMRAGAFDYASKPFDPEELALSVQRAAERSMLQREVRALRRGAPILGAEIVGRSPAMTETVAMLRKVADSPSSTILITGETGTGKDLAARSVHYCSQRKGGPFLNITCSAIPTTLLEAELFGHEAGAFTDARTRKKGLLEEANQGTVFLDEIGEIEPMLQAKLLRFLEEKRFRRVGGTVDIQADVRVIAATNVDLQGAVARGSFRRDLYYRLAVLWVHLPPLRSREGDIPLLISHFIERFNREFGKRVNAITPAARRMLGAYHWPGNVRELRNAVERAVLLAEQPVLDADHFHQVLKPPSGAPPADQIFRLPAAGIELHEVERSLIVQALEACGGNQTRAANLLGLSRDQVRYRIAKYDMKFK